MDKNILFNCACYMQSCSNCQLVEFGCSKAPTGLLLKAAREHYAEMKRGDNFDKYDACIAKFFWRGLRKRIYSRKGKGGINRLTKRA